MEIVPRSKENAKQENKIHGVLEMGFPEKT